MAHADYDCCAICDCKLKYAGLGSATRKESVCENCLVNLQAFGLQIVTVGQFIAWVLSANKDILRETLKSLGFRKCHFDNAVDGVVRARGIEFGEARWVK